MTGKELDRLLRRRTLLKGALGGVSAHSSGALGLPLLFGQTAQALAATPGAQDRILVVLELPGGNDGLNTLVPFGDDAYYRHRPNLGIKPSKLRKIDPLIHHLLDLQGLRVMAVHKRLGDDFPCTVRRFFNPIDFVDS